MLPPVDVRITEPELQYKFNCNEGGYPSKIDSLRKENTYYELARPQSGQPVGTMSVVDKYWDGELPVMVLHWFELPSGHLGASGLLDPKRLLVLRVSYFTGQAPTV